MLRKALEAITSPRRLGEGRLDPVTGKKLAHATLLGHGLIELVENHLSDLPSVNGSPFTLVVTIGYDALISGIGVAITDTGCRISAGEARRLACKAGVIPMVLDGDSVVMDVSGVNRGGREAEGSRAASKRGVAAKPTRQAQRSGRRSCPTTVPRQLADDTGHGIALCPPHHQMADHPETWNMRRLPTGGVRFTRRQ